MLEWIFSTRFLDAEIYPIDFLPSQLSLTDILYVIFGVVVLSLLVTIYPARRAAAIQPAEVLRAD
jgi:lipoprotein-releasing system permease protein